MSGLDGGCENVPNCQKLPVGNLLGLLVRAQAQRYSGHRQGQLFCLLGELPVIVS